MSGRPTRRDFRGFEGTARYAPARLLGAGGMGAVYEVEDRATGGRVALKVMLDGDPARLLRFKQEFRVMAELHHRNLVRLFDLGQHDDQWFFTMELVHGQDLIEVLLPDAHREVTTSTLEAAPRGLVPGTTTLADPPRLQSPACDLDAFVPVMAQILDALEFLHGRGIVHRDLKPSNIMVDLDGVARVLDFGLASRLDRTLTISHDGAIVGTLAYLSPEQYVGAPASAASDLYALGCMMYQLLTGDLPFQGSPAQVLAARFEGPPPRVEARVAGAPPALCALVHRLMARDPAERPTLAEVRAALGTGSEPPSASPPAASGARLAGTSEVFVGRKEELSVLAGCLEKAARGEPAIALLSGPSGIGKSALAERVVRHARSLGFLCFAGRCYEREQVPFVAFDRAMDALTLTLRAWPPERLAALRPSLIVLARIFPALAMLTGGADDDDPDDARALPAGGADPRELRQQAIDGFLRLCAQCQAVAPLCFVLDDLQWADEESVELLRALLAGGAGRRMVLAMFRPEAVRADHPLERLLFEIDARGGAARIALGALGPADAAQLVEAVTGSRLGPGVGEALATQTEGNPFLVRQVAQHLATLAPAEQGARLQGIGSTGELLGATIRALSPRAEQVLALAATAGGDIEALLLREAGGLGGEDFDLAVGELMAARVFKAVPRGPDGGQAPGALAETFATGEAWSYLDVYHDRIREAVYQGLGEERRRALHRGLAHAIEARPGGRGRDAEVLARHYLGAGEPEPCRRYAVEAAEQAAAKLAFVRAARLFRIVLDDPPPGEPPLTTAARWERVGELLEYGGRHLEAARAYEEALSRWDAAPEAHPDRLVARLRLRGLCGANLMATGRIAEGRALFEGGLSLVGLPLDRPLPQRIAVLAGLHARRALAERLDDHRPRATAGPSAVAEVGFLDQMVRACMPLWTWPAAEAALRGEVLGRRIDDKRVLQRSLAFGATAPVFLGRCSPRGIARAHLRLDAADQLARDHALPLGRELVQLNRSVLWLATNADRARRTCEAALQGFARRGMSASFDGNVARMYYFYVLLLKGDDDDALALIDRELGLAHPNFINATLMLSHKVDLLARRGLHAGLRDAPERLRERIAGVPASRLHLNVARARAAVLVAEGRFTEALAGADAHERAARASGAWAVGFDRSLWLEVQLEAALGALRRGSLAAPARRRARASAAWLADRGLFDFVCLGHRALALLDDAEGRPRAARQALRRALSLSSAGTTRYHRWLCLETARDLGALTQDDDAEATELAAEGRFVAPGR